MNTWFRRAVGTVGVAGGILLLGAGAAHAQDSALVPGQLDDLFSPAGGPNNQSLQLEAHTSRLDTSTASTAQDGRRTTTTSMRTNRQQVPNVLRDLPLSTLLPTDSLGLPQTTSSRLPVATEGSLTSLPVVGGLEQLGLPGVGMTGDTLKGTSIADRRAAFPGISGTGLENTEAGGLPLVGNLPLVGGLPVQGTLKPIDDFAIPVGGGQRSTRDPRVHQMRNTEAVGGLPVVGDLPLGGSDVLKNDSVTGVPVIGGVGPTPGVSTTAVANRFVPTTGALPQATSQLPLVAETTYAPRHSAAYTPRHSSSSEEGLPVLGSLPLVGGLAGGGGLPIIGGLPGIAG